MAGVDTYPTLFVPAKNLPSFGKPIYGTEIYKAVENATKNRGMSECIQKLDGLWRITMKDETSRISLLTGGISIRGHHITVLGKNPYLVDGEEGVRLTIKNIAYSVSTDAIKGELLSLGVIFGSEIDYELYRVDQKLTSCSTGNRFAFIQKPKIPLPKEIKIAGKFKAYLSHKGQEEDDENNGAPLPPPLPGIDNGTQTETPMHNPTQTLGELIVFPANESNSLPTQQRKGLGKYKEQKLKPAENNTKVPHDIRQSKPNPAPKPQKSQSPSLILDSNSQQRAEKPRGIGRGNFSKVNSSSLVSNQGASTNSVQTVGADTSQKMTGQSRKIGRGRAGYRSPTNQASSKPGLPTEFTAKRTNLSSNLNQPMPPIPDQFSDAEKNDSEMRKIDTNEGWWNANKTITDLDGHITIPKLISPIKTPEIDQIMVIDTSSPPSKVPYNLDDMFKIDHKNESKLQTIISPIKPNTSNNSFGLEPAQNTGQSPPNASISDVKKKLTSLFDESARESQTAPPNQPQNKKGVEKATSSLSSHEFFNQEENTCHLKVRTSSAIEDPDEDKKPSCSTKDILLSPKDVSMDETMPAREHVDLPTCHMKTSFENSEAKPDKKINTVRSNKRQLKLDVMTLKGQPILKKYRKYATKVKRINSKKNNIPTECPPIKRAKATKTKDGQTYIRLNKKSSGALKKAISLPKPDSCNKDGLGYKGASLEIIHQDTLSFPQEEGKT